MDKVIIDRRSLAYLFLIKYYKAVIFVIATTLFVVALNLEFDSALTVAGYKSILVFLFCIVLWVTNAVPLAITGLLAIVLIPTLGVLPGKVSYAFFGNEAIFFILGAFILAAANKKTGLSERVSLEIMLKSGGKKRRLIMYLLLFSASLAFIMPVHAVAAILFPVITDIVVTLNLKKGVSNFGKALYLSLAWGCITGGVATFLGGARNPLAIGLLEEITGETIGFFQWMIAVIPAVLVMLFFAYNILIRYFKVKDEVIESLITVISQKKIARGSITFNEVKVAIVTLLTVLSWILFKEIGIANIALLSAVSLFILNVISWEDASTSIDWGIIIMYGGAISLGTALVKTKAVFFLADSIMASFQPSAFALIIIFIIMSIWLTEGISNSAVVVFLLPVALSIAAKYNINPKVMTLCIAVPSGLVYMLPTGSPPNAICYSSGFYTIKESFKAGLMMNILSIIVLILTAKYYWPLIGLNI
ncbi:DASS family sodium-coupled anion symporter [Thermodesulfobacteriota bacterium]